MQTKKINLKEFKKESLHIKKLLEAKGGSCPGGSTRSIYCQTYTTSCEYDNYRRCDTDY